MTKFQTRKQFAERNKEERAYRLSFLYPRYPSHPALFPGGFNRSSFNLVVSRSGDGSSRVAVEMLARMIQSKPYSFNKKFKRPTYKRKPTILAFVEDRGQFLNTFYRVITGTYYSGDILRDATALATVINFVKACRYSIRIIETYFKSSFPEALEQMREIVDATSGDGKHNVRIVFSDKQLPTEYNPAVDHESIHWLTRNLTFIGTHSASRTGVNDHSDLANLIALPFKLMAKNIVTVSRNNKDERAEVTLKAVKARGYSPGTMAVHNFDKAFWDFKVVQENNHV